jgi:uncharacterized protein (TIGR03435 family)
MPKMKKADPAERTVCREGPEAPTRNDPRDTNPFVSRLLTCRNTSMSQLAWLLFRGMASGYVESPVFDATGLEDGWDFTLSFGPPPGPRRRRRPTRTARYRFPMRWRNRSASQCRCESIPWRFWSSIIWNANLRIIDARARHTCYSNRSPVLR